MIDLLTFIVMLAVGSWIIVTWWFFAMTHARMLRENNVQFGWIVKVPIYILLPTGAVADILFNVIWGSIIFREIPQEWFFTQRVKRWAKAAAKSNKNTREYRRAKEWKERINKIQPGHI